MISRTLLLAAAACMLALPVLAADMPYAGQHTRAIKALSDDDIAAFARARGWKWRRPPS